MRTTLYSRLKPEHKEILESKSENYPFTYKCIKKSLKKNNFYSNLTLSETKDLILFVNIVSRSGSDWFTGKDLFSTIDDVA